MKSNHKFLVKGIRSVNLLGSKAEIVGSAQKDYHWRVLTVPYGISSWPDPGTILQKVS